MDFEPDFVMIDTDNIVVSACQSACEDDELCNFCLRIENNSADKIQILSKNLNITDQFGNQYTDYELGFNGEIPELEPGEYFEFEDCARLKTTLAVLYGTCRIKDQTQNTIKDIQVPVLELFSSPKEFAPLH